MRAYLQFSGEAGGDIRPDEVHNSTRVYELNRKLNN